jgi:hypothetical protein
MRLKLVAYTVLGSLYLLAVACGDEPPLYPPLPQGFGDSSNGGSEPGSGNVGNDGSGDANSSGSGNTGNGGSGNTGNMDQGGESNSGTGGSAPMTGDVCKDFWSGDKGPAPTKACDLDKLADGGTLKGDLMTRSLDSGKSYTLEGVVRVLPGQTLTIPPCTVLKGKDQDAVLVAMSGAMAYTNATCSFAGGSPGKSARIVAKGEPNAPIIFTSSKPKGSRAPADWAGLMLLGNGYHNATNNTTRAQSEGLEVSECYGWHTHDYDDDDSGELSYVRIEYTSKQVGLDVETNGLTLAAVGSKTKLHHVMVSNSADDCFEWFGGAVSADHLIAHNCDDDMFDADRGYSGKVQFMFGRQFNRSTEAESRGFEIDSTDRSDPAKVTKAEFSNFTICGGGPKEQSPGGTPRIGFVVRTSAEGRAMNGLITGFRDGAASVFTGAQTKLEYATAWGNGSLLGSMHEGGADWFSKQMGNSAETPLGACDCWSNPPAPISKKRIAGTASAGFPVDDANYRGAFANPAPEDNWMKGLWVDWSSE